MTAIFQKIHKYGIYGSLRTAWQLLAIDRPKFYTRVLEAVRGKSGCEIGGPSFDFGDRGAMPLYRHVCAVDNFQYSATPLRGRFVEGEPYRFHARKPPGIVRIREAYDLGVPAGAYEFVLASHVLEHCANPIKVLHEWQRVTRPGSALVISLPNHQAQFDHRRPPTAIEHMQQDYANGVGEDDLTHLEEIRRLHDHPDHPEAGTIEQYWEWARQNSVYRVLHHHVFNAQNTSELLEAAGLKVAGVECVKPFHVMSLSFRL